MRQRHVLTFVLSLSLSGGLLGLAGCSKAPAPDAQADAGSAAPPPGKETFDHFCTSCHAMGAAGAPKIGDKAAWAPRIAQGMDVLVHSAINGKPPGMPQKGLCVSCSDADLRAAVQYMVDRSR